MEWDFARVWNLSVSYNFVCFRWKYFCMRIELNFGFEVHREGNSSYIGVGGNLSFSCNLTCFQSCLSRSKLSILFAYVFYCRWSYFAVFLNACNRSRCLLIWTMLEMRCPFALQVIQALYRTLSLGWSVIYCLFY